MRSSTTRSPRASRPATRSPVAVPLFLPGRGAFEVVDELVLAGALEVGEPRCLAAVPVELLGSSPADDDGGLDGPVFLEGLLHLDGRDELAAAADHVVRPARDGEGWRGSRPRRRRPGRRCSTSRSGRLRWSRPRSRSSSPSPARRGRRPLLLARRDGLVGQDRPRAVELDDADLHLRRGPADSAGVFREVLEPEEGVEQRLGGAVAVDTFGVTDSVSVSASRRESGDPMHIRHPGVERTRSSTSSRFAMRRATVGTSTTRVPPYASMVSGAGSGSQSVVTTIVLPAATAGWTVRSISSS